MQTDAQTFFEFLQSGKYLPAVGIALIALVSVARASLGVVWPWFKTRAGGYALGFGSAFTLYIAAALRDGHPMTFGVIAAALGAGWAASGGFEMIRDLMAKTPNVRPAVVAAAALAFVATSGCAAAHGPGKRLAASFVDCMAPDVVPVIAEYAPAMKEAIAGAITNTGKFDREKLRATASSLKTAAGQCVFAAAFDELVRTVAKALDPAAPQSSPLDVDLADARATFDEVRTEHFGGATFRLETGTR